MKPALVALTTFAMLAACDRQLPGQASAATSAGSNAAIFNVALAKQPAPLTRGAALALMKTRHERMEKIGDAMKAASRELRAPAPDIAVIRASAATFATLAPKVPGWYPPGTGPDIGRTDAKAEIWRNPGDFAAKARDFNAAAKAYNAAAKGGDLAAIRAASGPLGKSCKACHDVYREED